jgi:hypothetical protein
LRICYKKILIKQGPISYSLQMPSSDRLILKNDNEYGNFFYYRDDTPKELKNGNITKMNNVPPVI